MSSGRLALLATAVLAAWPLALGAAEDSATIMELGVAAGGGWLPDYPAASQNHFQAAALPTFVYRGDILRSDEAGLRGRFLRGERVQLDVSLNGAVPTKSSDNNARQGMPDLDLMGEIGPYLRFILLRQEEVSRLDLNFGFRAALIRLLDHRLSEAWCSHPKSPGSGSTCCGPAAGCDWVSGRSSASQRYMDYFYEVKPRYAREGRPAFDADPGYLAPGCKDPTVSQ